MATLFQDIYVDWISKTLRASDTSTAEVLIADFIKYESRPLRVHIIAPDPTFYPLQFSHVSVSPFTLKVTLNDTLDDAAPLAEQSTWVKDTSANTFSAALDLNTAGMSAYVGSNASVSAYFQIELTETGGVPTVIYQRQVTIQNSVTQPTTTSPDVSQTYYTAQQTDGLFLKAVNGAGVQLTMISPSGTYQRIWGVDDAGQPIDQILSYP